MHGPTQVEALEPRRLLSFGDYDLAFGTGGRDVLPANAPTGAAGNPHDVIVLRDGRIAVSNDFGITLYKSDGSIDSRFSGDGVFPLTSEEEFHRMAQASDDSILVFDHIAGNQSVVRAIKLDGTVDTSFGTAGQAILPEEITDLSSRTFAVDSQGRIVITGDPGLGPDFASGRGQSSFIMRLTSSGAMDTSFGGDGLFEISLPNPPGAQDSVFTFVHAMTIDSSDRIVLSGQANEYDLDTSPDDLGEVRPTYELEFANTFIARLNTSGALDTSFDTDGAWFDSVAISRAHGEAFSVAAVGTAAGESAVAFDVNDRVTLIDVPDSGAIPGSVGLRRNGEINLIEVKDIGLLPDGRVLLSSDDRIAMATRISADNWQLGPAIVPVPITQTFAEDGNMLDLAIFAEFAVQPDGKILLAGQAAQDGGDGIADSSDDILFGLARIDGGNINDARPDVLPNGTINAAAPGPNGEANIAYFDSRTKNLKYRFRDATGRWSAIVTVDAHRLAGLNLSIAVDSKGNVAIAYLDAVHFDLKVATRANGSWTMQTVDSHGITGLNPSIQYIGASAPVVSFYNSARGDLRLATFKHGAWTVRTVASDGDVGRESSLVINPDTNRISIAYTSADNSVLFAEQNADLSWKTTTVATTAHGAYFPRLAYQAPPHRTGGFDPYDPIIAYYDAGSSDLHVALRHTERTSFVASIVAHHGATGLYPSTPLSSHESSFTRFLWWDRTDNAVESGVASSSDKGGRLIKPTVDSALAAVDGGKFLTAVGDDDLGTTIVYQDSGSGNLLVRSV